MPVPAPRAVPPPFTHRPFSDPSHLAPQDADSSPWGRGSYVQYGSIGDGLSALHSNVNVSNGTGGAALGGIGAKTLANARRKREKERTRSKSRRRKDEWKKLLWSKQPFPDNYTDAPTFLSHLQRNPRLQLYDFWPLVADSTTIVQHLCSVAIFTCCFVGISQERVYPISVVGWGSAITVAGWVMWEVGGGMSSEGDKTKKRGRDKGDRKDGGKRVSIVERGEKFAVGERDEDGSSVGSLDGSSGVRRESMGLGVHPSTSDLYLRPQHSRDPSNTSMSSLPSGAVSPIPGSTLPRSLPPLTSPSSLHLPSLSALPSPSHFHLPSLTTLSSQSMFSARNQQRLATAKSALLIYCALLGLSPILKSLTKSTSSDSIWALSTWLMIINIFFFDYGGGEQGVKFPASLSTNAACMASTVLASRLPSTTHVFSLTLFSIEVFGLFPVFRRHLRHRSWRLHVLLTVLLIIGAGAGMGVVLAGSNEGASSAGWSAACWGIVVWGGGSVLGMGGCSWWLIRLQRYKNVVIGPWDPARPVIRGGTG